MPTSMPQVRDAVLTDLPALTEIYNHYVVHTPITFDVTPYQPEQRRQWFDDHAGGGRYRLLVADAGSDGIVGYATSSRWRPKAAYETTVESTVYLRHDAGGRGIGTHLYRALFAAVADQDVHTFVAGVALPNVASLALHKRIGFEEVGVFRSVGRKFGRFWDVAWLQKT
jgi:phosphinothricin acetyltransferase